jgi:predicted nucleic acid-binding protein
MKFVDSNIFIYAFYKAKRKLAPKEEFMKRSSKEIITRIGKSERVCTSVVHISEMVNVLKHSLSLMELYEIVMGLFAADNILISDVPKSYYLMAVMLYPELKMEPNDALAIQIMRDLNIKEIYSFDSSFDDVEGIQRIPKFPRDIEK